MSFYGHEEICRGEREGRSGRWNDASCGGEEEQQNVMRRKKSHEEMKMIPYAEEHGEVCVLPGPGPGMFP